MMPVERQGAPDAARGSPMVYVRPWSGFDPPPWRPRVEGIRRASPSNRARAIAADDSRRIRDGGMVYQTLRPALTLRPCHAEVRRRLRIFGSAPGHRGAAPRQVRDMYETEAYAGAPGS
jgi:hypothetical protein